MLPDDILDRLFALNDVDGFDWGHYHFGFVLEFPTGDGAMIGGWYVGWRDRPALSRIVHLRRDARWSCSGDQSETALYYFNDRHALADAFCLASLKPAPWTGGAW